LVNLSTFRKGGAKTQKFWSTFPPLENVESKLKNFGSTFPPLENVESKLKNFGSTFF
jgi:hypothetical protein